LQPARIKGKGRGIEVAFFFYGEIVIFNIKIL
jgi:hypothetical protein